MAALKRISVAMNFGRQRVFVASGIRTNLCSVPRFSASGLDLRQLVSVAPSAQVESSLDLQPGYRRLCRELRRYRRALDKRPSGTGAAEECKAAGPAAITFAGFKRNT